GITRMHLEEDAGKSKHLEQEGEMRSLLDLNRCGVPLLEIVSEPDMRSPEEARAYLVELKQILEYCGVCDGDMEKGNLRCDANLSVRRKGSTEFGVRTEIKNLNSFRNLKQALAVEFKRHVDFVERGEPIIQATMLWDENAGKTRLMRSKEDAHDYRYFPEPDLPPLVLSEVWIAGVLRGLPELPDARRARYRKGFGIRPYDAVVLTATRELGDYFEIVASRVPDVQAAANFIGSALLGVLNERQIEITQSPIAPEALADILILRAQGTLSSTLAKRVLEEIIQTGKSADAIIREQGWEQVDDDGQLRQWAEGVIEAHPTHVEAYLGGKESLMGFFMGQIMQRSKGRAHPTKAQEVLLTILKQRKGEVT
ncbi:MAG: Asp-tRNA(Asn)/Glu-tRNA(Gln) amidotransferase subunit GatB, partial [Candidatus Eisenbacteria sp.]|nr:Asp-tRNA(Asn)/Glu-tRNA(Gln) amidotransferase subunit GatB [Candidatus Eisenbacteria bacterium]